MRRDTLFWCLLAYAGASLIHFSHNAEFLSAYPNLPMWWTTADVYAAWLGVSAVGVAGYWLLVGGHRLTGLLMLAFYALTGFAGLGHYAVAPMAAHTLTMNLSIWFEVATASAVVAVISARVVTAVRSLHQRRRGAAP